MIPASQQYLYSNTSPFLYIFSVLAISTYSSIPLCMYVRCTCMYVLTLYLFIPIDWSISISLHMYIYTYLSICIYCYLYVSVFFIHTLYLFSSDSRTFPLSSSALLSQLLGNLTLFSPPAFMLLILPEWPWEDTERGRESQKALLPSRLLCLLPAS